MHAARQKAMVEKDAIVLKSTNENGCVGEIKKLVEKFARAFVSKQHILKKNPREELDGLIYDLEDVFRDAFVTKNITFVVVVVGTLEQYFYCNFRWGKLTVYFSAFLFEQNVFFL